MALRRLGQTRRAARRREPGLPALRKLVGGLVYPAMVVCTVGAIWALYRPAPSASQTPKAHAVVERYPGFIVGSGAAAAELSRRLGLPRHRRPR